MFKWPDCHPEAPSWCHVPSGRHKLRRPGPAVPSLPSAQRGEKLSWQDSERFWAGRGELKALQPAQEALRECDCKPSGAWKAVGMVVHFSHDRNTRSALQQLFFPSLFLFIICRDKKPFCKLNPAHMDKMIARSPGACASHLSQCAVGSCTGTTSSSWGPVRVPRPAFPTSSLGDTRSGTSWCEIPSPSWLLMSKGNSKYCKYSPGLGPDSHT